MGTTKLPIQAGAVTSVNTRTGAIVLDKDDVNLDNVDNTSDASKPVSTATQTALDLKAPIASPTFTGTVSGITKSMVGLSNVDNTTDAGKPVSTAQQTALDLKAPIASPTFTGTVSGITKSMVGLGNVDNTSDATKDAAVATLTNKTLTSPVINSPTGIVKGDVGLSNVDNTSDATKNAAAATLTNKTIDAASNTISNITNTEIKSDAAIAFSKLAALTSGNILVGNVSNVAASVTPSGQVTMNNAGAFTLDNAAVIAKVLTGYTSGAGTVAATDTILQAIQKLNGNIAAISGGSFSGGFWNTNTSGTFANAGYTTFEDEVFDTDAYSSDGLTFTIPSGKAGKFLLLVSAQLTAVVANAINTQISYYMELNGAIATGNLPSLAEFRFQTTTSVTANLKGWAIYDLAEGDDIKIYQSENVTNAMTLSGNASHNYFALIRLG